MINKRRGMFTFLMAVILLLTGACSSNSGGEAASPVGTPIATSTPVDNTPVKLKIMGNYNNPELNAPDKKFVEELEKINNVTLEFDIPPATGYNERLQLMIASGDYPDIVWFPDTANQSFQNAVRDGILVPVNDYLASAKNLMKYSYATSWDALKANQDERIYGIPRTSVVRNDGFWVRKDWLDNVGISIPDDNEVSIDQFADILNKFTFNDPDKNGTKDTYGYAGVVSASSKVLIPILTGPFGLTGWQETNGKYKYMNPIYDPEAKEFKNALEYSSKLYKEGVYDPDSAVNDDTKQRERFWRGLTGVYPGFAAHYTWHLPEIQKNVPNAELTYIFVKDENGKVKGGSLATSSTGLWGFWAITKQAKSPQKAVDLLDSWLSDDIWSIVLNGYEGFDYAVKDGVKVAVDKPLPVEIRRNTMRRAYDSDFFISFTTTKDVRDKITPWLQKSLKTVVPSKDPGFVPGTAKKPAYMDYQKVWDQTIMKIIMGQEPIDKFDELLAGWYKNGGEEYVTEMNDYISKLNVKK
ncbi:MAG TPA: extracellular solute-binding protein [Bacilli bacterium]